MSYVGGGTHSVRYNSGSFLLQALLAIAVVSAFIPFFARRIGARDNDARMYATTRQVENAARAARIYVRENADDFTYGQTVIAGNAVADTLEEYGLPMGFVPKTPMGQDIKLVITKEDDAVSARLELVGGNLRGVTAAELARRIGFYAAALDDTVVVGIALDEGFSDVVRRNDSNPDGSPFMTNLDIGGFSFDNVGSIFARRGQFDTGAFGRMSIMGVENGRKVRNQITAINANKTIFQSKTGEAALSLTRGVLGVGTLSARTISRFGDAASFVSNAASVYDFSMTAGRSSFVGGPQWNVGGNLISDKVNFSVERLDINSYLNATRGQDVYITDDLEYSSRSGIDVGVISAANITMRDQTSDALMSGGAGAVIMDIRPAGTSVLPDVLIDTINNDDIKILRNPSDSGADTVTCQSIINGLGARYNRQSLAQNIICQYVFWHRLEKRIDIKQCLQNGGSNCD